MSFVAPPARLTPDAAKNEGIAGSEPLRPLHAPGDAASRLWLDCLSHFAFRVYTFCLILQSS